ncbi:MAG TPA: 1-acyl-sn-glycerol-3-phosphate acyltransferase [Leptospiraceae bacterium]|nr:1-acyl-sn-glycerol-3-phosphate acyltransferase [Spirochaetaceae bacterium]HBS04842.1 1-acyl-sn-glycerol-3-phosphate acyltransferase [Leptospiraceae bacterium]
MSRIYKKYEGHPGKKRYAVYLLELFGQLYTRMRFKVKVQGIDNIPKDGPVLILAKHVRNSDIPLGLVRGLHPARWDVWCIMKDSLAKGLAAKFFLHCGGIPVDRKNPEKSKRDLLIARKILHDGHLVTIFPEQTHFKGKMGRGRTPGFRFVVGRPDHPVQIVPLGFEYKDHKFPRRTEVLIRIGLPTAYDKHSVPDTFLHERMHEIAELSGLKYTHELLARGKPTGVNT